jgi:catechol 2,3-dioxygenase-like lactoylglutathione lyase family enzyme
MTEFLAAVPIVPVRDVAASTAWYRDRLGFDVFVAEPDYGIVGRGEAWIHFCGPSQAPIEDSIRTAVHGIDELHAHCAAQEIADPGVQVVEQPWGFREFSIVDGDGRDVTFFEPPTGYDARS